MRKALKRAAHVLAAAGAFGLVQPAIAQMPTAKAPTAKPGAGTVVRTGAQEGGTVTGGQGKLEELQVELALLSNPGTFAYALGARHTGAALELRGYVPNKLIKDQALEIARKNCGVPVVDKLQLHSTLTLRSPSGTVDELQQGAATLLTESFGDAAVGLEIKATTPGHISIKGSCDSYERKMEISKKLRGLNGCCAVENHLTIKPVLRDGLLVTLVTDDGSFTVPSSGGYSGPVQKVQHLADSAATVMPPAVPPPVLAATPPKPAATDLLPPAIKSDPLPPLASGKPDVPPPLPSKTIVPPPPLRADAAPSLAMKNDVPSLPPINSAPLAAPAFAPVAPSTAVNPSPLANTPAFSKTPTMEVKAPAAVEHLAGPSVPVKVTPPQGGVWPPAHDTHMAQVAAPVQESRPVQVVATMPEKHPVQVAYATTGVVLFEDDSLPEPPPMLGNDKAALLKQKVAAVCGAKAREVVVETKSDGLMHVTVKTTTPSENKILTDSILMMPEMASPNVKLHLELTK